MLYLDLDSAAISLTKLVTFVLLLLISCSHQTETVQSDKMVEYSEKLMNFATNIYKQLALLKPNENVVFSPFSIQTCAAMARVGAEGETAMELDNGLGLASSNIETMAEIFNRILLQYEQSPILKIANKIYVMKGYTVQKEFNDILAKQFLSSAEEIDFAKNVEAAKTMNEWVEAKTNNLIKDLVPANALDSLTRLVLLNAIHFKGEWTHKFDEAETHDADFYLDESNKVQVPMMSQKKQFRYAELPELDATALEMTYKNTDLSMLIILPNTRSGLKSLEQKLQSTKLSDITSKLYSTKVIVKLPRFKAEFNVELSEPFKALGMTRMFSNRAEFGKMLDTSEELKVSKVIHKAFIEVNEQGTEAAAATAAIAVAYSMIQIEATPKSFIADKSFYYFVKSTKELILFAGSINRL